MIVTGQSSAVELGPRNALMLHFFTSERAFKGTNDSSTHLLEPPSGDIIKNEIKTVDGTLRVPKEAGLGIEVDEKKLDHYHQLYLSGKYQHAAGLGRKNPYLWF